MVEERLRGERAAGRAGEQGLGVEQRALLVDVAPQPGEQRAEIARRWRPYFERYGYSIEDGSRVTEASVGA